jgi:hypothetical protein
MHSRSPWMHKPAARATTRPQCTALKRLGATAAGEADARSRSPLDGHERGGGHASIPPVARAADVSRTARGPAAFTITLILSTWRRMLTSTQVVHFYPRWTWRDVGHRDTGAADRRRNRCAFSAFQLGSIADTRWRACCLCAAMRSVAASGFASGGDRRSSRERDRSRHVTARD